MNSQPVHHQVRENIDEGDEEMAEDKMVKKKTVLHRYFTLTLSKLKATAYHKLQPSDKSLTLKFQNHIFETERAKTRKLST